MSDSRPTMQDEADAQLKWVRADAMKAQIDAAVKAERERCAKVAETCPFSTPWVAAAIRKGEQP
jgi:hypothetical protein